MRHLKIGDRIGVGWQMSSCLQCPDCLKENENLCGQNQGFIIEDYDGFADYVKVDSRSVFSIPKGIETEVARPLLCRGITVYSGLRYPGISSGQEIGVIGIGGLGHLAVQFASKSGNSVTVFTTSQYKAKFAHQLGANHRFGIKATIETFPLQQANEAIQKVRENKVRYCAVLKVS